MITRAAVCASLLACALALTAAPALAQVVSGVAEWTVANGSSTSDGQPYANDSFWQRYTVAFNSALIDPRLLKYNADVTFRTNSLTFGGDEDRHHGRMNDVGYSLAAALFPMRSFPFVIQATRGIVGESGDYPSSNGIRGGIVVPPGDPLPDFRTRNESLSMSWLLNTPALPRVEVNYRSSSAVVNGGSYHAEQHDVDFHSGIYRDTPRTRQALRFDRHSTENVVSQAFNNRLTDLGYDFSATLSRRNRLRVRAGRRTTFSLFDVPSQIVDSGTGAYLPPSRGTVESLYAITGVTYEPHSRLSIDLTASIDRQDSARVATGSRLLSTAARFEPFRGLSLSATGTYGDRDQMVGEEAVGALTRHVQAGATYRVGVRWVDANVGYSQGLGSNTTPDGRIGDVRSWAGQAGLSITLAGVTVGGGYDRSEAQDEILDFGNYDNERQFLHAQTQVRRVILIAAWDDAVLARGRDLTLTNTRQRTFTASASARVGRDGRLTASAGGFSSHAEFGRDETRFAGATYETPVRPRLVLTVSARYEELTATETSLAQKSLGGYAKLEYRLRLFSFAAEYHHNEQDLRYASSPEAHRFRGHQFLLRISRTFGLNF